MSDDYRSRCYPTIGSRWRHREFGGTYELVEITGPIYTLKHLTFGAVHWQEMESEANANLPELDWEYAKPKSPDPGQRLKDIVEARIALPMTVDLQWFGRVAEEMK